MRKIGRAIALWRWEWKMRRVIRREYKEFAKDNSLQNLFKLLSSLICVGRVRFKFKTEGPMDLIDYRQYSVKRNQTQYLLSCKTTMQN